MITLEQALAELPPPPLIHYPESDGKPMGDNDQQRDWMNKTIENLKALFAGRPDVYVTGNLFWYPVEGNNRIVQAPDAMVTFGRPPGLRGCYKQWEESGIPPQVVFELVPPNNTLDEMVRKRAFYQKYGVEEYYVYDLADNVLEGYLRSPSGFDPVAQMNGWRSPRLGISFELGVDGLALRYPNGQPFREVWELFQAMEEGRIRAEAEAKRAEPLAAKLRALGVDSDQEEA
jgi:Uma2 family endonuclease